MAYKTKLCISLIILVFILFFSFLLYYSNENKNQTIGRSNTGNTEYARIYLTSPSESAHPQNTIPSSLTQTTIGRAIAKTEEAFIIPTPIITATPYGDEVLDISGIVSEIFPTDYKLDLLNNSQYEQPVFEYLDTEVGFDPQKYWISEVAYNTSKTKRAFIACNLDLCQQKVYLQNLEDNSVKELNWSGRIPWRPIQQIIWVGDDVLIFGHATSPHDKVVYALRVSDKTVLLYWLLGYP